MAQHSHSVYGNLYPHSNYYQKNKSGNVHHHNNLSHINNLKPSCELSPTKKKLFKSTDVLNRSGKLPFSNRNGKLHRSNPHLHFGGLGLSLSSDSNSQNSSASGASSFYKPSSNHSPYFNKTQSKWRNEISNAANLLPRKVCDFVFRRNADNKLYRSESFRFIQKTNSLQLLPPLSGGYNMYLNKHLEVPVSEDYVDPLDHIIRTSPSTESRNNKSTSEKATLPSPASDNEEGYKEIIANYNAPYYYSDTIKEPTYCSPCPNWRQSCEKIHIPESQEEIPEIAKESENNHHNCQQHRSSIGKGSPKTPNAQRRPMARKRYETAFLPSNSQHPSQSSSPDVDCLLLVIESSCSLIEDRREGDGTAHHEGNRVQRIDGREVIKTSRLEPDPSISYCQPMNHSHAINHTSGSTTSNSSPLSDKKPKPTMPLSEPLPQKKYSNINTSSSCSSSSPSTSASLSSCRPPPDKRLLMTMMKDNSVSSLESIDSTKSEDLHSFSRQFGGHRGSLYGPYGRGANCKLLSPISDKSPLEPISILQSSVGSKDSHKPPSHHSHERPWHNHLINTADLINVPWDMPKIKRRLALLADSGISLDCTGNTQGDSGQFSSDERKSFDDSHFQYTAPALHIIHKNPGSRISGGGSLNKTQHGSESGSAKSKVHNLQLNLDYGLVQDEYYEDPRLNFTEQPQVEPPCPPPKPKFPWLTTDVTSVQVHVPGAPVEPPKPRRPDRCRMTLDFGLGGNIPSNRYEVDPSIELEAQEWFHGAITRCEAEAILRATKEGSFLIRNCESSSFNRYSLSLKSTRGYIHVRIEPNSLGTFSLGEHEFPSVSHLVLHFMYHRLPIKGAEHVKLLYPVITQLL